jgi:hypothetical protein
MRAIRLAVVTGLAVGVALVARDGHAGFTSGTYTWGDADCSGLVDGADSVSLLRAAAAVAGDPGDCPSPASNVAIEGGGTRPWGDLNCGGDLEADDVLTLLKHRAGLPPEVTAVCPSIGAEVVVESAEAWLWYRVDGGPNADEAWAVTTDIAGAVYYATHQTVQGPFLDWVIYKLTPKGDEIWSTTWGRDWADQAFVIVVDGSVVYVGGYSQNAFGFDQTQDMALAAFDAATGDLLWDFTWDQGFGYEELDGLVPDGDHIYVAGWTTGETTSNDIAVLKLDRQGSLIWARTFGGDGWDEANGQIVVDDDNIYIGGRVDASSILFGGNATILVVDKESGSFVDQVTWGTDPLIDNSLGLTTDGEHLYSIGFTGSQGNGFQLQVRKYTFGLDFVWETVHGGPLNESARVGEIRGGALLIAGGQGPPIGEGDVAVWRLDTETGDVIWERTFGGDGFDYAHGLAVYGETIYVAGETESTGAGDSDAFLVSGDGGAGVFPVFP